MHLHGRAARMSSRRSFSREIRSQMICQHCDVDWPGGELRHVFRSVLESLPSLKTTSFLKNYQNEVVLHNLFIQALLTIVESNRYLILCITVIHSRYHIKRFQEHSQVSLSSPSGDVYLRSHFEFPLLNTKRIWHILTICVTAWVYESETGDETPVDLSYLVNRLEMVIPGTGVHQTFLGDPLAVLHLTHQKITNILADRGIDRRNVSPCHKC